MKTVEEELHDGYHSMQELYDHRHRLYIALAKKVINSHVWISKKHHDGGMFEGYFIMGIGSAKGRQISYHLPLSYWKECSKYFDVHEQAPYEFDGHTSEDVLLRLEKWGAIL